MRLPSQSVLAYQRDGMLLLPDYFSAEELDVMTAELAAMYSCDSRALTREPRSGAVRGIHGVHMSNPVFETLVRLPRLVEAARQLLADDVYVHQFKINAKLALVGEHWEWHQDYLFWHLEDGMPSPNALTFGIFLDDVTEFNGPLMFVPGSHQDGVAAASSPDPDASWEATLATELKYRIDLKTLLSATTSHDITAPKGPRGNVLIFHSNILHCSAPNLSPRNRTLVLVSYNAVGNRLEPVPHPRPQFLANRDFTPLTTVRDDALLGVRAVTK